MGKTKEPDSSTPAPAPPQATAAGGAQVIYLGPRLYNPVHVAPNAVFRGELPAELAALAAKDSDIKACLVSVEQAGRALRGSAAAALAAARANVANRYGRK